MNRDPGSAVSSESFRDRLLLLRQSLAELHKRLIDSERAGYEQTFGNIHSQNRLLHLLIHDPWFAWLHPLSELIVAIDETLDAADPVTADVFGQCVRRTQSLLVASETGDGFPRSFFEALQREPDVVLASRDVRRCLNSV